MQVFSDSLQDFQEAFRQEALKRGFCAMGYTSVEASPHAAYVRNWMRQEQYGEMHYLAKNPEERLDPKKRFPWLRSALLFAFPYGTLPPNPEGPFVARYARGEDYHHLLERKLKALQEKLLQRFPHAQIRAYVDTGPLLERELARQAGLGFLGKNTLLLHRHHGSYFFLATLLSDIPFQSDRPVDISHCGSCTRCIEICPTQALKPYQMDARKCISYLTIEKKGSLSEVEMEGIGSHFFGCDLCQEVCPFNRRPFPFSTELSQAHPLAHRSWKEILSLEENTFEALKSKSPLRRSKLAGLLRNALVALAHSPHQSLEFLRISYNESPLPGVATAWNFLRKKRKIEEK